MAFPPFGTPTGQFRSGKGGRVSVGGTALTQSRWNNTWTAPDNPTVNFESFAEATSQSFTEGVMGPEDSSWAFGGSWNAAQIPFATPPAVYPRDDLEELLLYTNVVDSQAFTYDFARVRSTNVSCDVGGLVTMDAGGNNQGVWFAPGVNV